MVAVAMALDLVPEWETAVRRHDRIVWLSIVALGVPPDVARDLAQATWMRLFEQVTAGAITELKLPGLAIVQARFLALEELRRMRRQARRDGAVELERAGVSIDGEAAALDRNACDRVFRALDRCTPNEQAIFRLTYDEGLPHAEIAATLGLSTQRVRQSLCELRRKLRTIIEEEP